MPGLLVTPETWAIWHQECISLSWRGLFRLSDISWDKISLAQLVTSGPIWRWWTPGSFLPFLTILLSILTTSPSYNATLGLRCSVVKSDPEGRALKPHSLFYSLHAIGTFLVFSSAHSPEVVSLIQWFLYLTLGISQDTSDAQLVFWANSQ